MKQFKKLPRPFKKFCLPSFPYFLANWLYKKANEQELANHYIYFSFSPSHIDRSPVDKFRKNEDGSYVMYRYTGVSLSSRINDITIFYYFLTLNWTQVFAIIPLQILYFYLAHSPVKHPLFYFGI